ncbi:hypothetical protein [Pseudomonas mosselii]|uniref:hypothetical protein n=1 Tax=Pseudomonas mosselii TaxID=78327 RepID=UPI0021D9E42A|nr:hypothetical protein [Pseudomonas mosselii]MCU9527566.1 hypothetical protein [Pseudomonas mosselii]MCU9534879.1 hypothetical protein [Pseudomonas mosselii]MCU9542382.1 hypothetical protein [Pseudomonas mosselii]MCU9546719.1 hypothetical protein [Pseudomonas mosselii]
MANETTEVNNSHQVPERSLRIDGERTAAMYALAIRVARLDVHLRGLAGLSQAESRKMYRLGCEGFQQLIGQFEDGLTQLEKDVDIRSRRGAPSNQQQRNQQRPATRQSQQAVQQRNPAQPAKAATVEKQAQVPTLDAQVKPAAPPAAEKTPAVEQQQAKPGQGQKPEQRNGQQQKPGNAQRPKTQQQKPQNKPSEGNKGQQGGKPTREKQQAPAAVNP